MRCNNQSALSTLRNLVSPRPSWPTQLPGLTFLPGLDTEKEELLVQVNTLRYELENFKQERDLMVLHHEKDLRDLQLKADSDFRKAQVRSPLYTLH
ncbi:hypothetical protein BO70DRAFT_69040 [Aspergillus heteromorphus CBS 117.55]|uniref:Uncharacterized protein n=1 Tax=Aspergillus heteromorphus CBS 117.55 TaxID=1448321 RepID=A0A317VTA1_9EURO|nr:uncharacterized protein BO70DRAFT_69040 [Aspergillus heteromorphus CBS 117.55]PWY77546.1 hypothetical protein BO70DRAFT_69040 [Aspergillus heteromorphus CBS 117.55]